MLSGALYGLLGALSLYYALGTAIDVPDPTGGLTTLHYLVLFGASAVLGVVLIRMLGTYSLRIAGGVVAILFIATTLLTGLASIRYTGDGVSCEERGGCPVAYDLLWVTREVVAGAAMATALVGVRRSTRARPH